MSRPSKEQLQAFLTKWTSDIRAHTVPLDSGLAREFVNACLKESECPGVWREAPDFFAYKMAEKRCQCLGMAYSSVGLLFTAVISTTPAIAVMVVAAVKGSGNSLTTTGIANTFPMGFPSDAQFRAAWDAQKGSAHGFGVDNMLDCLSA